MTPLAPLTMALSLVVGLPALADGNPALVEPAGSGLELVRRQDQPAAAAFRGTALVHGVLVAQWAPDPAAPGSVRQEFRLVPGAPSAGQLPHFQGHPVQHIVVGNGPAILRTVAGPALAADFNARRAATIRAEAVFSIEAFEVGVACGSGASARIVEADPINAQALPRPLSFGC